MILPLLKIGYKVKKTSFLTVDPYFFLILFLEFCFLYHL